MGFYTLFLLLIILAALLMIFIVLIQESNGGGLSSNFSSSNQIMGVRKTTDVVEKATWGLAAAMVVLSVICAYVAPTAVTDQSVIERTDATNGATNANNVQGFGASQKDAKAGQQAAPAASQQAPKAPTAPAN